MSQDLDDELKETFFQECADLMEVLESGLLSLSREEGDAETINAVFRATHSIKGGAGAFNLTDLVRFAHRFETALDEVRNKNLEPTAEVLGVFLRCADTLGDLVNANAEGQEGDASAVDSSVAELGKLIGDGQNGDGADSAEEAIAVAEFTPLTLDFDLEVDDVESTGGEEAKDAGVLIRFKPHAALYERGNEATLIIRALAELTSITVDCEYPEVLEFEDPALKEPALTWLIKLESNPGDDKISEIFEFVDGDCELSIQPLSDQSGEEGEVEFQAALGEVVSGDQTPPLNTKAEPEAKQESAQPEEQPESSVEAKSEKTIRPAPQTNAPKKTIRVDLERVDSLINLVGELAINQAMLTEQFASIVSESSSNTADRFDEFKALTREIQERVMAVRAQPVKPLFQRMARITREAAAATEKSVRLIPQGEDTEVDATIVERLADPLTHMIRNAVDHGLETSEKRSAAKKSPDGEIKLSASHRSGRILIRVSDDGAGINRDKVFKSAVDKGLVAQEAQLTDAEIDNLLFLPGFSTASEVSDLSGRGVGMDVVKRSIQSLGGRTSISSEPGKGTTFTISLPLTLAVLDVIVVRVAMQTLAIPLSNVVETLNLRGSHLRDFGNRSNVVLIRDKPVPIVDVGYILDLRSGSFDVTDCVFIVVETSEGEHSAIPVDEIYDQRQVVMKGLEANYGAVPGIAAATILGNGEVALILDLESIIEESSQDQRNCNLAFAE